jgi:limonene-1,2-epoxide hydrolase
MTEQANPEHNRSVVEAMWRALGAMDWELFSSYLHPDVHYQDVPTDDPGAHGPENTIKRLKIAFDQLEKQEQVTHRIAAEGDVVFIEHTETWTFKTGETAAHTFVTVHEMKDGKVFTWSDYWDVNRFVSQFPQWFIEHMMSHTADHFID